MTALMSLALSRLESVDWDLLPDGMKPCSSSLLMTRPMSGNVRFSNAEPISGTSRFELVLSVLLTGTKPCCSSKLMTRGMLGTDRFSINESRLRASRFPPCPCQSRFVGIVTFALGTKPACLRLTMYESMIALMELFWLSSVKDSKTEGSVPRAMSDAKPAAWSAGRLLISDAIASNDIR